LCFHKNLTYCYALSHQRKTLFQNLNLRFEANRIIALAGESGCGKSTLLSLIYGLLDWESGDIIFDGKTVGAQRKSWFPEKRK
jgi:ABC-type sugar transport system ATPase subunit